MANTARNHRDNVFCMLYRDRGNLLSLYNVVDECICEDALAEFFREHKSEVIEMGIFEYDAELHDQAIKEESWMEGKVEGRAEAILELLEELEPVPEELRAEILSQRDLDVLKAWHKAAARAVSLSEWKKLCLKPVECR